MIFTNIFFSALAYVCLILVWLSLVLVAPKTGNKIWASWQEAFAAMTTYWRKRVWRISRTCACVCLELYVYPFKPIPLSLSTHPTVPIYLPFAMCWQWSVPIYFCSADWCLQLACGICLKALPSALKTWPGVHCSDSGLMTHGPLPATINFKRERELNSGWATGSTPTPMKTKCEYNSTLSHIHFFFCIQVQPVWLLLIADKSPGMERFQSLAMCDFIKSWGQWIRADFEHFGTMQMA